MRTALVAIAKDEDRYLKEWVDYNIDVGFTEIFVYQNNWRYKGGDIAYDNVHLIECDGHRMQVPSYNNFINGHWMKFDFAAFFDIDEFLYIKDGRKIGDVMESYLDLDSVYVNWRLFGDSGIERVENENYSVRNRFIMCAKDLYRLGKHILNLKKNENKALFVNPHIICRTGTKLTEVVGTDPNRKRTCIRGSLDDNTENEPMELYHFRNKTWEEAVSRRFMQDDAFHEASMVDFRMDINAVKREFLIHNKNEIENRNIWKELA